jgi:hypothetical protein
VSERFLLGKQNEGLGGLRAKEPRSGWAGHYVPDYAKASSGIVRAHIQSRVGERAEFGDSQIKGPVDLWRREPRSGWAGHYVPDYAKASSGVIRAHTAAQVT